jgi:ABC-type glycerol-3-phosphate transport system substrate-binding protein
MSASWRRLSVAGLTAALGVSLVGSGVAAQDGFDPMRFAGCTVRIALVDGEKDEGALRDLESQIEAETGINIDWTTLEINALGESNDQNLRADESNFDIMHVLGFWVAGQVGTGLFEEITDWVNDPTRVPEGYDLSDFPEGQLDYTGYFDVEAGQFGGDDLYLIPGIHSDSVMLFYRTDLLEAAGIEPPTTWEEYLAAAEALTTEDVAGSAMIGANDISNFLVDWYARFLGLGGQMTSGSKDDGTLEVHFDSPEGVAALQNMIDLLPYSPPGVTTHGFTEALDQFMAGNVAMWPSWVNIAGPLYGPDSPVRDTVGVAVIPGGKSIRGGWGLGIPKNIPQEQKECAFHLLTYLTSKDFEKHQVLNYQTAPNRLSMAEDPEVVEALPYIPTALEAMDAANRLEFADIPETFEIIGEVAREINLALTGVKDAQTAMTDAQAAATAILQRAGHQAASE